MCYKEVFYAMPCRPVLSKVILPPLTQAVYVIQPPFLIASLFFVLLPKQCAIQFCA